MIFTGSGNANKISGIPVASGTPTDTYTLTYDATNNKWVYATNGIPSGGAVGGASAVAANQILYGASSGVATSTSTFVNTGTGVGIGTGTPAHKLDVLSTTAKLYSGSAVTDTTFYIGNADAISPGQGGILTFHASAATPYFSINAVTQGVANRDIAIAPLGGNVGIGLSGPAYKLEVSTDSAAKPSTNTWTIASDSRLKTVRGEYSKGLAEICQVRPVRYEYNGKGGMVVDGKEQISIIAQELREVFPECVSTYKGKLDATDTEETEMYNYNGHAITFALINAIKELKAEIDVLKVR